MHFNKGDQQNFKADWETRKEHEKWKKCYFNFSTYSSLSLFIREQHEFQSC